MGRPAAALMLACLLALLPACGPQRAYSGPRMPRGETAILRVAGTGTDVGMVGETRYMVRILTLDGRPYRGLRNVLEVLPGRHTLVLRWTKMKIPYRLGMDVHGSGQHWVPIAAGNVTMEVEAEAGQAYDLDWPEDGPEEPAGPPRGFLPIER